MSHFGCCEIATSPWTLLYMDQIISISTSAKYRKIIVIDHIYMCMEREGEERERPRIERHC